MATVKFTTDIILPAAGVDSAFNRNEYQEYFLRVGGDGVRVKKAGA
jgi:hypothetical protein